MDCGYLVNNHSYIAPCSCRAYPIEDTDEVHTHLKALTALCAVESDSEDED